MNYNIILLCPMERNCIRAQEWDGSLINQDEDWFRAYRQMSILPVLHAIAVTNPNLLLAIFSEKENIKTSSLGTSFTLFRIPELNNLE